MMSSKVRDTLVSALHLDLVGPSNGSPLEREVLPQTPSRWYLTGFLAPSGAKPEQKADDTVAEEIDQLDMTSPGDDEQRPDPPSAKKVVFPSSMGMSLLLSGEVRELEVTALWGDYRRQPRPEGAVEPAGTAKAPTAAVEGVEEPAGPYRKGKEEPTWHRQPREAAVTVALEGETGPPRTFPLRDSEGLEIVVSERALTPEDLEAEVYPPKTRTVSVFLVNSRKATEEELRDEAFAFQVELRVRAKGGVVPRYDLRGLRSEDWDERVADLQYRDTFEYAVGHGVATEAVVGGEATCTEVRTAWIPTAPVEYVAPSGVEGVEFSMEALSELAGPAQARACLEGLAGHYEAWIGEQRAKAPKSPKRRADMAQELLDRAQVMAGRIRAGINLLQDEACLEAFRMTNRVMARAARQRTAATRGVEPGQVEPPRWRPFQLAFLLMNLPGIADPSEIDREVVDLLFFPTGGGKTEAYLGLASFTLVLRRLRTPGIGSAGLSVLMRYTLRLLTLDQLGRAATLICALELERQGAPETLGTWPFEIGLWVGLAATPNRMGKKGDNNPDSARARTLAFQNGTQKASPIPLENCPWCGEKFKASSFQLLPRADEPEELRINCLNRRCDFSRGNSLPVLAVDEPIYRRLPCFLIATVDKFAAMPWTGEVGAFFGRVDRYDEKKGFYGPCDGKVGKPLTAPLAPPDLIIQDELHLISGPLGTVVGLYESALDTLCSRAAGEKTFRPKIVASTATVRRADGQIRALFDRRQVDIFPPPGPDRRDSFFAETHPASKTAPRLYAGVAAQGRSLKVVLLRSYLTLMGAASKAYRGAGAEKNKDNPADSYMTLVGYFNSLRELGGSRRIVEDEVSTRLKGYAGRKRVGETEGLFADRDIAYEVLELTSRVDTAKVAEAKRRLALLFGEKDRVDVALATNMISVGLDIIRLGLMVVLGQPKTSAEYIQCTSRVGRDPLRPGLVVTLLNIHRPRDRSHYERFRFYHETFYRSVEATSVTPFSPRALDRGLAGTLVGLARLGIPEMTPPLGAGSPQEHRTPLESMAEALGERARRHANLPAPELEALARRVRDRGVDLLDSWAQLAHLYGDQGVALQYQREAGAARRLLYEFLNPQVNHEHPLHRKFRANRSMRDVEPNVNLWMKTLDQKDVEDESP